MQNIHINYQGDALNYDSASLLAKGVARQNQMHEPTIMAWRRHNSLDMYPAPYEGADPETWWEKYGAGNGGFMEISLGTDYCFIMMDASGYETVDQLPLRNLSDSRGDPYLCFTPMLGKSGNTPTPEACTALYGWLADQY